jgi:hypothetical protein
VWERSLVLVELTIRTFAPIITDRDGNNGLTIGLVMGGALIVAFLLGVGAFPYRKIVNSEEAVYMGSEKKRAWLITPNDEWQMEEAADDRFKTRDFGNVKTGNYETMADYADLTIEADEIFI